MLYKGRSRNRDTFTLIRDCQERTFSTATADYDSYLQVSQPRSGRNSYDQPCYEEPIRIRLVLRADAVFAHWIYSGSRLQMRFTRIQHF